MNPYSQMHQYPGPEHGVASPPMGFQQAGLYPTLHTISPYRPALGPMAGPIVCTTCKTPKSECQIYTDVHCPRHPGYSCYRDIIWRGGKVCPFCNRNYSDNEVTYIRAYIASLNGYIE